MSNQTKNDVTETPSPDGEGFAGRACSVFVVIIEDRHTDVDVEIWTDKEAAIRRARELAKEYCRHKENYEEEEIDGWLFFATYSCEGDSCRVVERPIISPNVPDDQSPLASGVLPAREADQQEA